MSEYMPFDAFAFLDKNNPYSQGVTTGQQVYMGDTDASTVLLCKIGAKRTVNWGYKAIDRVGIQVFMGLPEDQGETQQCLTAPLKGAFTPGEVTPSSKPDATEKQTWNVAGTTYGYSNVWSRFADTKEHLREARNFLLNGFQMEMRSNVERPVSTPESGDAPRFVFETISYETRFHVPDWGTTYGGNFISTPAGKDLTLEFQIDVEGVCYYFPWMKVSGNAIQWRQAEGTTISTIEVENTPENGAWKVTIPKETFGTNQQVQIRPQIITDDVLTWIPDSWLTITMQDSTPVATPVSPVGEIIDRTKANKFEWRHETALGLPPTKSEIQTSKDGSTWSDALTPSPPSETNLILPGGYFTESGTWYWRVRTYNTQGTAGGWSAAAKFYCIGAPTAPIITNVSKAPRPVVQWQAKEQTAYQIKIEGVLKTGVRYGTEKMWTAPQYLEDGAYTVEIRVMNEYEQWSEWSGATAEVENTPMPNILLTGTAGVSAALSWETEGNFDFFLVYRNGVPIAKTTAQTYVDMLSNGGTKYQIRGGKKNDGNYGASQEINLDIECKHITLADTETGEILELKYSTSAHQTTSRNTTRDARMVQLAGKTFPIIERGKHQTKSTSVACAFKEKEDSAAFEKMLGQVVALKEPDGGVTVGCLMAYATQVDVGFYAVYSFTLTQIETGEGVDLDAGY